MNERFNLPSSPKTALFGIPIKLKSLIFSFHRLSFNLDREEERGTKKAVKALSKYRENSNERTNSGRVKRDSYR